MDTVTFTIDGRELTVPKGKTVLQAAIEHGIKIPFYCYHPGLGVDGSCRVCLVKIEKMPKLQVSCSVVATDGMVVYTNTPEVEQARAGVFEFLLINHPLDCPVCDKGGECPLQDYSYSFGRQDSRMEFPRRTFDGEGVRADVDFGPTLMLNRNRCILCTRCVRFMRDIDGDAQIGIVDRGYGSEVATYREEGVHSLLSGNLMDVCPVGAITTRDYRFKSRPWDNPNAVDTICTLCEKGCNTTVWIKAKPEWAKGSQLARITPRFNADVNSYWMCDIGRFGYHWVEGSARLGAPLVGGQPAVWDTAISEAATLLKQAGSGLRVLLSAHASNEEMFVTARLAQELLGEAARDAIDVVWTSSAKPQPETTKFRVPEVDAPNVSGARALGLVGENAARPDRTALDAALEGGRLGALLVVAPGPDGALGEVAAIAEARRSGKLSALVVVAPVESELTRAADVVLAGCAWVEKDGTFTNEKGHLQAASKAVLPPGSAREDWHILVDLARAAGADLQLESAAAVREAIGGILAGDERLAGIATIEFRRPAPARHWLQASNPMERWKWDVMFQDLPPFKFADTHEPGKRREQVIPLKEVK
ncbi:MAG: (2Fe-2S)-binding protein [Vicinamibacteraceae bacterium]|nr:(2Fe-2S)-binding protein [Vicinamibacteraceae bacterium]